MTCRTRQRHTAGISLKCPCPNIPSFLNIEKLDEFYADRELAEPIDLPYIYTEEKESLNGVLTTLYGLGTILAMVEKNLMNPRKLKAVRNLQKTWRAYPAQPAPTQGSFQGQYPYSQGHSAAPQHQPLGIKTFMNGN